MHCACTVSHVTKQQFSLDKMKFPVLLVIASCFALAAAQEPERCNSPSRWMARITRIEPYRSEEARGTIAYDRLGEQYRITEERFESNSTVFYDTFYLYEQKTRYRVDLRTKQCEKRTLNDTFRPIGVPDYAKYLDTVEIGSNAVPRAGIQVTLWAGDNPEYNDRYVGAFTSVGCVPVMDSYYSASGSFSITNSFFDVVPVPEFSSTEFKPPEECLQLK